VAGSVDVLPEPFWLAQSAAVMQAIREEVPEESGIHPFSIPKSIVRRPFLAFASLAAALALVAGLSVLNPFRSGPSTLRPGTTASATRPHAVASPDADANANANATDTSDDELLRSVDSLLSEETPYSNLIPLGVS
jgi:hypothetical protein